MLAALYARVSTLRQENEETIENQIQRWQKKRQLKSDTSFDNVDQLQQEDVILPTPEQIKVFSERAKQKLTSLRFEAQRAIMLKVVDTIIADQETLRVRGALYLSIQEEQNVKSYSEGRDYRASKCGEIYII